MRKFENIIIGFGKGGKTLAGALAKAGQSVAVIERSKNMYGGTCINIACIPTKSLEYSARLSAAEGGSFEEKAHRFEMAIDNKNALTAMLRGKNYDKVISSGAQVIDGEAAFVDAHTIEVKSADGSIEKMYGEKIFINTGSDSVIPNTKGLKESRFFFTSKTLMEIGKLPKSLVIIGGGYIGLEFASYFANFGSKVTVIQHSDRFIPKEDKEIADAVLASFNARGIDVRFSTNIKLVEDDGDKAVLTLVKDNNEELFEADAILAATGRKPELSALKIENAAIELTESGAVKCNEFLQTNVPDIWVMGDAAGGMQFTYISLDDFRIVKDQLLGDKKRSTKNRGAVPYSVFIDPPVSRIGLTEEEAKKAGYEVKTAKLMAAAVPKAQVLRKPVGMLKAVVDAKTGMILGAHLFCAESHEMINIIKLAMDNNIKYTALRDNIFTHPTMSEAFNDLFSGI